MGRSYLDRSIKETKNSGGSLKESNIQKLIMIKASQLGARLFRINVGTGWTGDKFIKQGRDMLIKNYRPFKTGVPKGYHDTSGWTPIEITQDMVGKKVAVFTMFEIKTSKGKPSPEQLNFEAVVNEAGGISAILRSEQELELALARGPLSLLDE